MLNHHVPSSFSESDKVQVVAIGHCLVGSIGVKEAARGSCMNTKEDLPLVLDYVARDVVRPISGHSMGLKMGYSYAQSVCNGGGLENQLSSNHFQHVVQYC